MTKLAWFAAFTAFTSLFITVAAEIKNLDLITGASLLLFMGGFYLLVKETY